MLRLAFAVIIPLILTAQWREAPEEKKLRGAVESGNEQLTATLLASGAHRTIYAAEYSKDAPELFLSSLLKDAAEKGRLNMAKLLVRYGAKSDNAYRPLVTAIVNNHPEVAVFLLEQGANPNLGSRHATPLMAAAEGGHVELVKLLLAKGAETRYETALMSGRDTAASLAAKKGYFNIVKLLNEADADRKKNARQGAGR